MNVKEIVVKYLDENGYDGLAAEDCGCGKRELFVCGEICLHCKPAYKRTEVNCNECPNFTCDNYGLVDGVNDALRGQNCVSYYTKE